MIRGFALKVTYNDGGAGDGGLMGYRGVCSLPTILENVKVRGMTNCRRQVVAQERLATSTKRDLNCLVPRLLPEGVLKLILI